MSGSDRLLEKAAAIVRLVYSLAVSWRFAAWGVGSRIEMSGRLVAPDLIAVGRDVYICEHAWLNAHDDRGDGRPTLTIGDGSYLGRFLHINAWQEVVIGRNVLIADRVFISDIEHVFDAPDLPIKHQGERYKGKVHLADGCWLGIGAVILPGVRIGKNSVVAANSVVSKDVPDRVVVAGVPAKIIRYLDELEKK